MRLDAAWVIAAALDLDLSTVMRSIEHTTISGGTRLDVHRLQHSPDPVLDPVRRWVTATHPDLDGPDTTIHLTDDALVALAVLMDITSAECLRRLQPYLESPVGPTRARRLPTTGVPVID